MGQRWLTAWPVWVPREIEVDRPVCEYIREWARRRPRSIALTFYGREISYAELNDSVDRLAHGLCRLGVRVGDRVAIHMNNCPQFVMAYFAVHRAGGVAVPVSPMLKGLELEHELNDAGVQTLVGDRALFGEVEKVRDRLHLEQVVLTSMWDYLPDRPVLPLPECLDRATPDYSDTVDFEQWMASSPAEPICNVGDMKAQTALLQYTGGTTGIPKGAVISHRALAYAAIGGSRWYHHREDDVFLGVTPFFHVMGQVSLLCDAIVSGARTVVLMRFDSEVVAQAITRYRCTHWTSATTMVIALLDLKDLSRYDFSSFRCIANGGASISPDLLHKLEVLAPNMAIVEGYGLSETASQGGACTPLYRHRPGFVGVPQLGVDLAIVDRETGEALGPNSEGEIAIRSASMMDGYWNRPEETASVFRNGWLMTGDIGLMDEEGYLKFLGRTKELIKCSGLSVYPAEVESILCRHPAVNEAAVIGVKDAYRGERPKGFVVLRDSYVGRISPEEIVDWCADNMSAYKRPREIEFRSELPKSAAGKLLRRVLAQEERSS